MSVPCGGASGAAASGPPRRGAPSWPGRLRAGFVAARAPPGAALSQGGQGFSGSQSSEATRSKGTSRQRRLRRSAPQSEAAREGAPATGSRREATARRSGPRRRGASGTVAAVTPARPARRRALAAARSAAGRGQTAGRPRRTARPPAESPADEEDHDHAPANRHRPGTEPPATRPRAPQIREREPRRPRGRPEHERHPHDAGRRAAEPNDRSPETPTEPSSSPGSRRRPGKGTSESRNGREGQGHRTPPRTSNAEAGPPSPRRAPRTATRGPPRGHGDKAKGAASQERRSRPAREPVRHGTHAEEQQRPPPSRGRIAPAALSPGKRRTKSKNQRARHEITRPAGSGAQRRGRGSAESASAAPDGPARRPADGGPRTAMVPPWAISPGGGSQRTAIAPIRATQACSWPGTAEAQGAKSPRTRRAMDAGTGTAAGSSELAVILGGGDPVSHVINYHSTA